MRWSPAQQSMLRELGCELFTVRETPSSFPRKRESSDLGSSATKVTGFPPARERRVLVVLSPDANWLRGPHARLARGVLAAVGIPESDVRGEPLPGAPALAFGIDAPDAVRAPTLEALRDARAKRALWPALRALRRRLRDADARG